ncbi:unnamed protein product, partial [Tetraodon nigroviridis]
LPSARDTPSPIDPESIQVPLSYEPDPADLALSSVPGQEMFDPRKRKFSAEELKPQPMIKKARKVFIPEDMKDERYWARRRKNNVAAKRSRDARRLKENQIAIRASFLEKENAAAGGGGRHQEGAGPLQEHSGQIPGPARAPVSPWPRLRRSQGQCSSLLAPPPAPSFPGGIFSPSSLFFSPPICTVEPTQTPPPTSPAHLPSVPVLATC